MRLPDLRSRSGLTFLRRHGASSALLLSVSIAALLSAGTPGLAQTWTGGTDTIWGTGSNWSGGVAPGAGGTATINKGALANQPTLNAPSAALTSTDVSAGTLTVSSALTSTAVNVSGTGTLTITAATGSITGNVTVSGTGILNNSNTITGSLSVLNGTVNNAGSISGNTTISGGSLNLNAGTSLADTSTLTVNGGTATLAAPETIQSLVVDGGTMNGSTITASNFDLRSGAVGSRLAGTGVSVDKNSAGTVTVSGSNTYTGATNVNAGSLRLQGGSAIVDTGAVVIASGANVTLVNGETIGSFAGAAGSTFSFGGNTLVTGDNDASTTFAGDMSGTGAMIKRGLGNLTLSGTNSRTGVTSVFDGTLTLAGGAAIADTVAVSVNTGATLALSNNETIGAMVTLAGSQVTLGSNTLTFGDASNRTISGIVSGTGGLTKQGTGTVTLADANTFTGALNINAGTVQVDAGGAVAGTSIIASGATLNNNGGTVATVNLQSGGTFTNSGTITGNVVMTGGTFTNTAGTIGGSVSVQGGTFNPNAGIVITGTLTTLAGNAVALTGGTFGGLDLGGPTSAQGTIQGAIANSGTFTVDAALVGNSTFSNTGTLNVTNGDFTGITTLTNSNGITISAGRTLSAGTINHNGGTISIGAGATLRGLSNTLNNAATINVAAGGTITDAGAINNLGTGIINFNGPGGTATLASGGGGLNIVNSGQINLLGGNLDVTVGNMIVQGTNGLLNVTGGTLAITGDLANSGSHATGVSIAAGRQLSAANISNNAGATIVNSGTLSTTGVIINAGTLNSATSASVINGSLTNSGTVIAGGQINGNITNSGTMQMTASALTIGGNLTNNSVLTLANGATGQVVTVNGTVSGTGNVTLDINYSNGTSDRLVATGAANTIVNLNRIGGSGTSGGTLTLVQAAAGSTYTVAGQTLANGQSLAIATAGFVQQLAFNNNGTLQVIPGVSGSAVANLSSGFAAVATSMNHFLDPASALVSGQANPDPNRFAMGTWSRSLRARFDLRSGSAIESGGTSFGTLHTKTTTDFSGFQGGIDAGLYNINNTGWNVIIGAHGGFVRGSLWNGDTSIRQDQPFYGLYLVAQNQRFTFDALLRRDHLDLSISSVSGGLTSQKHKALGWAGLLSGQYRFDVTEKLQITPSAAFLFSSVDMGALTTGGMATRWGTLNSQMGRLGIDIAYRQELSSGLWLTPFAHASLWSELGGRVRSTATSGATTITTATEQVGTFAQLGLGASLAAPAMGVTGFVRGDMRFGQRMSGYALNGGVRWQF